MTEIDAKARAERLKFESNLEEGDAYKYHLYVYEKHEKLIFMELREMNEKLTVLINLLANLYQAPSVSQQGSLSKSYIPSVETQTPTSEKKETEDQKKRGRKKGSGLTLS